MQQLSFTYSQYLFAISQILFFSLKVTGICQSLFIGGVGLRVYLWFVAIKNILFFLEWNRLSFVAIKKIKNKKKYLRSCGWSMYFVYLQVQGGSLHPHHLKRILKKITWGQKSDLGFQIYGSLFSPIPVKGSIRDSLQLPRRFKECKGKAAIGARNRGYRILLLKVFFKGFSSLGISMFNN